MRALNEGFLGRDNAQNYHPSETPEERRQSGEKTILENQGSYTKK